MKRARRTFGNIQKRPSGRWGARFRRDGRFVYAPTTFLTKSDASAWLAVQEAQLKRGEWVDPQKGQVRFSEYAGKWVEGRRLGDRTRKAYLDVLRLHILPTFGHKAIGQISTAQVRSWYEDLCKRYATMGDDAYRRLRAILGTAVADGLILRNPCTVKGAGMVASHERPTVTPTEMLRIVSCSLERYRAAWVLASWCALRREELLGLRRRNIDLVEGTVRVTRDITKTDAGVRTISIPTVVLPYIEEHLAQFTDPEPTAYFLGTANGTPMGARNFNRAWERTREAAGHPELHLHDLRHSGLTWAADTGASLKQIMYRGGHASPRAALIYQHASPSKDRELADDLSAATLHR